MADDEISRHELYHGISKGTRGWSDDVMKNLEEISKCKLIHTLHEKRTSLRIHASRLSVTLIVLQRG